MSRLGRPAITFQMSSERPRLSPDTTFRKLSKNDIHQTTDQWRERTLQRLGEVSGEWTAWVENDNIPSLPTIRPRPPVEPKTDDLMTTFKERIRDKRFQELIQLHSFSSQPKLEDVPTPSTYEAWEEYEEMKSIYHRDLREYDRREKQALETYPKENKRVFPAL